MFSKTSRLACHERTVKAIGIARSMRDARTPVVASPTGTPNSRQFSRLAVVQVTCAARYNRAMLHFDDLSLRRGVKLLFEHASFQIHPGQKTGVTGANGSGKSSLFALVLGELHADTGSFSRPDDWVIAHVAQEAPHGKRSALDFTLDGDSELRELEAQLAQAEAAHDGELQAHLLAQYEAIDGYSAHSRAGQLLHGLGFSNDDLGRTLDEFSGGWRVRLNLARALMCRSDLLLLDEPTNHLDLDAVLWLEQWLNDYPGTLLLVSHDRDFLDGVCTRILNIEQEKADLYTGNYSAFERMRAERLAGQQAAYKKQQREIAHMRSYVDRFRAKATKARQAQSRLKGAGAHGTDRTRACGLAVPFRDAQDAKTCPHLC